MSNVTITVKLSYKDLVMGRNALMQVANLDMRPAAACNMANNLAIIDEALAEYSDKEKALFEELGEAVTKDDGQEVFEITEESGNRETFKKRREAILEEEINIPIKRLSQSEIVSAFKPSLVSTISWLFEL